MDDLDDIVEAVIDVEDVAEELLDPDELIEDLVADPLEVLIALFAAAAALFTLMIGAILLILVVFQYGLVPIVAALTVLGLLATTIAIGLFLYVRTDVPRRVERRIERARERAADSRGAEAAGDGTGTRADGDAATSEEEAIERLREQYAEREISVRELEAGLEEIMGSDDPGRVVREYEEEYEDEHAREYDEEYGREPGREYDRE